jgi:uncharacterized protein
VRRRTRALALWLGAATLLAACGSGGGSGEARQLRIATGATGGVYFVYGGGLGKLIGTTLDGYQAVTTETTGSVANMTMIADGKADLAFTLADTAGLDPTTDIHAQEVAPLELHPGARRYFQEAR